MRRVGNYMWWDESKESPSLLVLLECLSYAVEIYWPLDRYLDQLFSEVGSCGGDPGWDITAERGDKGEKIYRAHIDSYVSALDVEEATFDEETVKKSARRVLEGLASAHPDRKPEVSSLLQRYGV